MQNSEFSTSMLKDLLKVFNVDNDNPPKSQKFAAFTVYGLLFFIQFLKDIIYQFLPRRFYLAKIAKSIRISPIDILKKYKYEDDLPPLKFKRTTSEEQLAGFKHELDPSYKPVLTAFQCFYNAAAYYIVKSCFHREIMSCPTDIVQVKLQDGTTDKVINTCSYNYCGFASCDFEMESLLHSIDKYGLGRYIRRSDGDLAIITQLESVVNKFLGTEASMVHFMGYDTNAMSIPCIANKKCLILSDQFNHNSLVRGCKYSGAKTGRFRHDDLSTLEKALSAVDFKKYERVIVIVEGLYSMEGSFVDLPKIVDMKKKYPFLLFVDEAHSIGSLGKSGRGIVDYHNLKRTDVDFSMGTFTKSFSSVGGYIAGRKDLIDLVRNNAKYYQTFVGVSGIFAQQIINALNHLQTPKGIERIQKLRENSIYFRKGLYDMGFSVYGNFDSPVVPLLFYNPIKMKYLYDELLRRKIAVVVVGYPAVPLVSSRIRFCISASHTKDQLDYILNHVNQLGDELNIKFELKKKDLKVLKE